MSKTVQVVKGPNGAPVPVPEEVVLRNSLEYRMYQDRLSGMSWSEVADAHSIGSSGRAMRMVRVWQERASALFEESLRLHYLQEELDRLDHLLLAVWPSASTGNTRAVDSATKVIAQRCRLLGLDQDDRRATVQQTIVVSPERYSETLREVVEHG